MGRVLYGEGKAPPWGSGMGVPGLMPLWGTFPMGCHHLNSGWGPSPKGTRGINHEGVELMGATRAARGT